MERPHAVRRFLCDWGPFRPRDGAAFGFTRSSLTRPRVGSDSRKKDKRRPTMMRISTLLTALAVALAASTLATPSFAQRSEEGMSSNRAQALKDCNAQAK